MSLSASMTAKRAALVALIQAALNAHSYGAFTVTDHISRRLLAASTDAERRALMGNPARYVRVEYEGEDAGQEDLNIEGGRAQTPHRFGVMLWFELDYSTDATFELGQDRFDILLESDGEGAEPIGLLPYVRSLGSMEIGEQVAYVSQPRDVSAMIVALNAKEREFAAYCEFAVVIT